MRSRRLLASALVVALSGIPAACAAGDDDSLDDAVSAPRPSGPGESPDSTTTTTEAEDAVELDGTAWRLTAIEQDGEAIDTSAAEVPAVVTFDGDSVEVYDGVNTASGEYRIDGASLSIELGSSTELGYPGSTIPQHELIDLLPSVEEAESDGAELELHLGDGPVLRFELSMGITPS